MAEAFLQVLLENLTCFIQGELGLILGFKDEFEKLQSTFTTIQVVLEDAQKKQLKDKAIENWLQKLNVAAYEADDILDECKTEATIRQKNNKYGCYHPNVIAFRHKIGKRMKKIMEKLDVIAAERIKFHLDERTIERRVATRQTGAHLRYFSKKTALYHEIHLCFWDFV
uniref:NBS-LRR resistance protein n=1 Tax=Solanum tuberosum TaxID=4113 RepID=M1CW83_SOLTU